MGGTNGVFDTRIRLNRRDANFCVSREKQGSAIDVVVCVGVGVIGHEVDRGTPSRITNTHAEVSLSCITVN